jgi:hypothetical protein
MAPSVPLGGQRRQDTKRRAWRMLPNFTAMPPKTTKRNFPKMAGFLNRMSPRLIFVREP